MDWYKIRKQYIAEVGAIPEGHHLHHIIPVCYGGTHDKDNLVVLSPQEHYDAHYARWERYGTVGDLRACQLLYKNWLCSKPITPEQRRIIASKGGKAAQKTLREKKITSFYDPIQRLKAASLGGKVGRFSDEYYRKRGVAEEDIKEEKRKEQSRRGKKGGSNNKGFIFMNNGTITKKFTKKMSENCSIEEWLKNNTDYKLGRLESGAPVVHCPHCGKSGIYNMIKTWHFDKCNKVTGKMRVNSHNTIKRECPHCGKKGAGPSMLHYHFENCKYKENKNDCK